MKCLILFRILLGVLALGGGTFPVTAQDSELPREPTPGKAWVQAVPGTAIDLVMRPVADDDGGALWVMEKELTWNLFDIFIFRLDEKKGTMRPAIQMTTICSA